MDLQWKVARQRHWIEFAARRGLTNKALAKLAGVSVRTVGRWCKRFRDEERDRYISIARVPEDLPAVDLGGFDPATPVMSVTPPPGEETESPEVEEPTPAPPPLGEGEKPPVGFAEVVPAAPPEGPQIQIDVQGGGRILLCGPLDPALLSRLIAVLKPC